MHLEATQPVSALCAPPNIERRLELPTLGVALAVHGGFLLLTAFFKDLPILLSAPLGSLLLAWYFSLQHGGYWEVTQKYLFRRFIKLDGDGT